MTDAIQTRKDAEEAQSVRLATPEEAELSEWARDAHRKSLSVVTDSLKQFVTLNAGLLGASVALFNMLPAPPASKGAVVLLLLASLGASLLGALPLTASVLYNEDIKAARDGGVAFRSRCLRWASGFLFGAFFMLAAGSLYDMAWPPALAVTPPAACQSVQSGASPISTKGTP